MRELSRISKKKSEYEAAIKSRTPLLIIGLNTGTSADGLDAVLAEFKSGSRPVILNSLSLPFGNQFKNKMIRYSEPEFNDGIKWLELDAELGAVIGRFAKRFITSNRKSGLSPHLLAVHGQTVRHLPKKSLTLQLGDPAVIAATAGIPVVANFRQSDIAAGGQGAPLSPLLHEHIFHARDKWRAIVNIGGIANITILPPRGSRNLPFAVDCGPGNMAIDAGMRALFRTAIDKDGLTAFSGRPLRGIIRGTLKRRFFRRSPPKSTGRELFGFAFFDEIRRKAGNCPPEDIIATVSEITVGAIVDFIRGYARQVDEIYLCGGGARNRYISNRLARELSGCHVGSASSLGYEPNHVEPLLWAFLGHRHVNRLPVNASRYTGAKKPYIPGALCMP
jgi:anhydro-N-acetylmuramic acid kinase